MSYYLTTLFYCLLYLSLKFGNQWAVSTGSGSGGAATLLPELGAETLNRLWRMIVWICLERDYARRFRTNHTDQITRTIIAGASGTFLSHETFWKHTKLQRTTGSRRWWGNRWINDFIMAHKILLPMYMEAGCIRSSRCRDSGGHKMGDYTIAAQARASCLRGREAMGTPNNFGISF